MDLHMKAYHLNHWLLSLHQFKYLHYSATLLSRGWNKFFGVVTKKTTKLVAAVKNWEFDFLLLHKYLNLNNAQCTYALSGLLCIVI